MKPVHRFALALALVLVAAPSWAGTVPQYSQLRHDYPQIDTAIAAAPDSELHGTFNRLSALFNRAPIDTALADAGLNGQLPANFLRNLDATLLDLQEDMGKSFLSGLTVSQKLDILQVVRIYAFRRTIELWQGEEFTYCTACPSGQECPPCVDDDPAVFNWLDSTATASRSLYTSVYNSLSSTDKSQVTAPSQLNGENFIDSIETIVSYIPGVESIDD